jgi:hypothetical protein
MSDPGARQTLTDIVDAYELMARSAERKVLGVPKPANEH